MQRKNYKKRKSFPDASGLAVGVVVADFNRGITGRMLEGALEVLKASEVKKTDIHVLHVPGSFEVPFGCLTLLKKKKYDALVALGCIIKGETEHDRYIAAAVSEGLMQLSLRYNVPIGFGIITTNDLAQAEVRSRGEANKGKEAALAAVKLGILNQYVPESPRPLMGF